MRTQIGQHNIDSETSEEEIVNMIQREREWLNLPNMSEEELRNVEIPENRMFVTLRVNYNGSPSLVRVVRSRDGQININVDFVQNLYYVRERIEHLTNVLGQLTYEKMIA
jgi:hypothetical protein